MRDMQRKKSTGVHTSAMDTRIRPQDDFFRYANGNWLKKHRIPDNESRWGSFIILRVQTEKRLRELVTRIQKGSFRKGRPEQMIRDFYRSGMDMPRRNRLRITPLTPLLAQIEKIRDTRECVDTVANLHKIGVDALWGAAVDQDAKDSETYLLHLFQDGLGMPDRDYYLKNDKESVRVRTAYMRHLRAMHRLMGQTPSEATRRANIVMTIETALAKASMPKEDARDAEKTYHKMTLTELSKCAPAVDWVRYIKMVGAGTPKHLIVAQPDFIRAVGALLETVPLSEWKRYLSFRLISGSAGLLSEAFVREQFAFYGNILSGSKRMKPLWRRVLAATNGNLGEPLGHLYVKDYFAPLAKRNMHTLVRDLFAAYERRIKNLDWMSAATKRRAVKKLRMMNHKVGYPDRWKSYAGLVIRPDDYFGNAVRVALHEHRRQLGKLRRPVDRSEWFMYPQTVNAYNSSNLNEIVFPAAILQPPFFDLSADDALNYGCIGAVIGHEMTHGFDDQGSKFDGRGNLRSWWSAADRKRFEKKTKTMVQQFNAYRVAGGIPVNGKLTLGENIADLGGLAIAFDAYQLHLRKTGRKTIRGFSPEQRFFLGFALFDCEMTRPEFEKMQVLTDPHSPSEFRINGPLSNFGPFYEAFKVKKGDALYRPFAARTEIW